MSCASQPAAPQQRDVHPTDAPTGAPTGFGRGHAGPLPPSDRDFAIFEAIAVERRSTRDVAREFGVSQTRICQIAERVWRWHAEVIPRFGETMPEQHELQASERLASDRLDHLYSLAMRGFEASKGEQVRHRVNSYGDESTTTVTSFGDIRYLMAAARLAALAGKLGASRGLLTGSMAIAADVREGEGPAEDSPEQHSVAAASPNGDCSARGGAPAGASAPTAGARDAKRVVATRTEELTRRQRRARASFFAPVQSPQAAAKASPEGSAIVELTLGPGRTPRATQRSP